MQILYPGTNNANFWKIPVADLPDWIKTDGSNSFTVAAWVRRASTASTSFRAVIILANLFHVQISSGAGAAVRLVVHDDDGSTNCSSVLAPANSEWIFFAASYNVSTHAMVMVARSQSKARTAATATYVPGGVTTRTYGDLTLAKNKLTTEGGGAGTAAAWDGDIGWVAVHNVASTQAELETLVDAAFTELAGQTGLYNPIIPLTGLGMTGHQWFVVQGPMSQEPDNGAGGARTGVTVTDTNATWWDGRIDDSGYRALATNAEVEAILDTNPTFDVDGTLVFLDDDASFFGLVPPGLTTNGHNSVPSNTLVELRDNAPRSGAGVRRGLCAANSRAVRTEWFAGGPAVYGVWAANFSHGLVASRYANIGGMVNVPVLSGTIRRPLFDQSISPTGSGTFHPITSGTYNDFSRLWTNSPVTGSNGPGYGVRFGSAAATLTQRLTVDAGTLLDGSTAITHDAVFLEYPGSPDTLAWEIEDAADVGAAGSDVATGTETGLNSTAVTYTYDTGTDSYSAGTPSVTVALPGADQTTIANLISSGEMVGVYVSAGTGTGSIAQILSITPGGTAVLTLKHAFNTALGTGCTLRFGRVRYRRLTQTAPIAGTACQGYRITADAGVIWFCVGAVATGVDGWAPGTFGHGGNGYSVQITDAWTGMYAKMAVALDLDWAILFVAGQDSSTHEDRIEMGDLLGLSLADTISGSDPVHRIVDNQTVDFAEDSLADTDRPAVVSAESCASLIAAYSRSYKHNITHPSIEQYKLVFDTMWTVAAGLASEPSSGIDDPDGIGYFSRNRAIGYRRLVLR